MINFKILSVTAMTALLWFGYDHPAAAAVKTKARSDDRPTEKADVNYPLGIIGVVEPVFVKPFAKPFLARIDSGAATSSIDVRDLKVFERDGKPWVSFEIVHPDSKEKQLYKRPVKRKVSITRSNGAEHRFAVELEIQLGDLTLTREFTLGNREKFEYPVLIGRNVISGMALLDVSRQNTLKHGL